MTRFVETILHEKREIEFYHEIEDFELQYFLQKSKNNEGKLLSEFDARNLLTQPSKYFERKIEGITSTFILKKGNEIKIILPYTNNSQITECAEYLIEAIYNSNGTKFEELWELTQGKGVYSGSINHFFGNKLKGLNKNILKEEALNCPFILTKLQHPNFVLEEFAKDKNEIEKIIERTYAIGEKNKINKMMGQYIPESKELFAMNSINTPLGLAISKITDIRNKQISLFYEKNNKNVNARIKNLEGILDTNFINEILKIIQEKDTLQKNKLTTQKIFDVVQRYIPKEKEIELKKELRKLTDK
jgi:hypothetical protein